MTDFRRALCAGLFVAGLGALALSRSAIAATEIPGRFDPIADPSAVVVSGHARFTILTPQLIRMEWAADGKFENRASLVFLNRKLPVPEFTHETAPDGGRTVIKTSVLTLVYAPGNSDGKFAADNLSITLSLDGREVVWKPGTEDIGNLLGTARTVDRVRGSDVKLEPGLISRDGWTLVDDSQRQLFDSADFSFAQGERSPWPWVESRPPGDRQDWYFFGYGHDYRRALYDFTRVAGKVPLPPRFAFGAWWSRYWSYTDQEFKQLIQGFQQHTTPLDVLVIDMDWHPTFNEVAGNYKLDASGHRLGWTGYSWNRLLFPDPNQFLAGVHEQGLKATVNLHPAGGVQPWQDRYPQMARTMGIDPATYYDWPEASGSYNAKSEYMFGDSILADPVTQPIAKDSELAKILVWLPAGNWIEWDSGASFHGPVTVERSFSISQIPLYVKTGSIIPMQPAMSYTGEKSVDPHILTILPLKEGQVSKYRLYEDAGDTPSYQHGESVWTSIRAALSGDGSKLTVTVASAEGHYKGMPTQRAYELRLPGSWPPSSVSVNGESIAHSKYNRTPSWHFDGSTLTTVIATSRFRVTDRVTFTVRIKPEMARNRALLDGFAGRMRRLRETYNILNAAWPAAWSPDPLIDAMQTGDRISYQPETAFAEVSGLPAKLAGLSELIDGMHATEDSQAFAARNRDKNLSRQIGEYNRVIDTALAHIADIYKTQPVASVIAARLSRRPDQTRTPKRSAL